MSRKIKGVSEIIIQSFKFNFYHGGASRLEADSILLDGKFVELESLNVL